MRTKRKRGWYRAIKRREPWALKLQILEKTNPLQFLFAMTYGPYIQDLIPVFNPSFLAHIEEHKKYLYLDAGFYHQPIILGNEHGVVFSDNKLSCKQDCPIHDISKKRKGWLW